ncbi:MAG: ribonuclease G [Bacteroidetes bacterium RIFCSPLOWO2_02_FULL_36_8]|nr:MAG: ribonuclease G [Bacteroidetes bacterium RIFCSPLOWO2_02_FULL_36_8]OFY68719.1 MAG: ribonuclease G [Bacteroidetes bacterium RIFCSPLOWO2_12_FULL_37_12]
MSSELIINSSPSGTRIALLENKKLVEYHIEEHSKQFHVGDIYLGKVTKLLPGLNASFIDIGSERYGFLHYFDMGPQFRSLQKFIEYTLSGKNQSSNLENFPLEREIEKTGKMTELLHKNQTVLVQILKEPISSKGPRLSCEISIPGRFLVLVPFTNFITISKKIFEFEERKRLKQVVSAINKRNFGIIIRTLAENKSVSELETDLKNLYQKWDEGVANLQQATSGNKVIGELDRTSSILRDMLNSDFDSIMTDDEEMFEDTKSFIHQIAPEKENIVKLHNSKVKIFESFGIEKQIKASFGKSVVLPGGGYLIFEHTEALHVIDVNSGVKSNSDDSQELTALNVNLDAAREIARQLRLRDIGGIIVVDFIDMKDPRNRHELQNTMLNELAKDRTQSKILPVSKFGLMQITRQRVRPETFIKTAEVCPTCNGTGNILPSILISDEIENNLQHILLEQNEKNLTLTIHPFLFAFFTSGWFSKQLRWFFHYFRWVKLVSDTSCPINQYTFTNSKGEIIEVK